jgi:hypothetical protein
MSARGLVALALVVLPAGCTAILGLGDPRDGGAVTDASVEHEAGVAMDSGLAMDTAAIDEMAVPVEAEGSTGPVCPQNWVADDAGACVVDFLSMGPMGWTVTIDANVNGGPTMATPSLSATSVTVTYVGNNLCGCAAEHLSIPLGQSYDCATTTLQFDYTTSLAGADYTNSPSLDVRLCSGGCPSIGPPARFIGSEYTGHSNCAIYPDYPGTWPTPAGVHEGTNVVQLATLGPGGGPDSGVYGECAGSFDTVDIHVTGYACFPSETNTSILSNLTFLTTDQ